MQDTGSALNTWDLVWVLHLFDGGMRFFEYASRLQEYLTDSRKPEQIRKDVTVLSRNEQIEEFMFLGLRMTEGISEKKV